MRILPTRMRRLSGLEEHFIRRRSSVMRSTEGTSSKLAAIVSSKVYSSKSNERETGYLLFFGPPEFRVSDTEAKIAKKG